MKRINLILLMLSALVMSGLSAQSQAANWLMLQGTEPQDAAPRAKLWGFLQPTFQSTSGTKLPGSAAATWGGQHSQFNTHQPDLASNQMFQLQRARIGIRGANFPLDGKINYFLLAELGNNGITQPGGGAGAVKLTDATVTFNHIKGARFRVGQMKIPMSEEVYQGIFTFNYINFTNFANQQLIERPFWTDGKAPCDPTGTDVNYLRFCNGDAQTQFRSSAVAVRDIGIQMFETFSVDDWEHSYAILIGQGGISKDDRDDNLDTTVYWASEKVFSGKGPRRHGLKLYAWQTKGKRTIYDSATLVTGGSLTSAEVEYDRNLTGIGGTYWDGKFRVWAELLGAEGMIFNGSTGGAVPGAVRNDGLAVSQFVLAPDGEGDGGYIDFGYRITPKVELDVRYDWYNRVTNLTDLDERKYETLTYGVQYFFNKKTRLMINYEVREFEAPKLASNHPANVLADTMDNRLSAQVFAAF